MNVQYLPTSILSSHSWNSETYKNIFMSKKKTSNALIINFLGFGGNKRGKQTF